MLMRTSASGRQQIEIREGLRLTAYRDSVGVLTCGFGHTGRTSPPVVVPGMVITQAKADEYLARDLAPVEATVNRVITRPMTQNQFDAMVSLTLNIGEGGFEHSTVVRRFNAGDVAGAGEAFMMWVKPAVLAKRRRGEMDQFLRTSLTADVVNGTVIVQQPTHYVEVTKGQVVTASVWVRLLDAVLYVLFKVQPGI